MYVGNIFVQTEKSYPFNRKSHKVSYLCSKCLLLIKYCIVHTYTLTSTYVLYISHPEVTLHNNNVSVPCTEYVYINTYSL